MTLKSLMGNGFGAFSDAAVLLPLLWLFSSRVGVPVERALFTTGCVYVLSSWLYRIPMAVQPLKSLVISAVALGASLSEVRFASAIVGLSILVLSWTPLCSLFGRVPVTVIHQLQTGLGMLLILQSVQLTLSSGSWPLMILIGYGAVLVLLVPDVFGLPLLGLIAFVGFLSGLLGHSHSIEHVGPSVQPRIYTQGQLVMKLVLPQIALTMSNSILATEAVARKYYGKGANAVTRRRLGIEIGLGNLVLAALGGMPYCHGSGGMTAHYYGGSRKWWSTALMGCVLILLGSVNAFSPWAFPVLPSSLSGFLLLTTGLLHLKLGQDSWRTGLGAIKMASAALIILMTKDLLMVLVLSGVWILMESPKFQKSESASVSP